MKFTIDTTRKMVALEADMTFAELESLKKFIGKGWEKWTIAKTTEIVNHYHDNYWKPYRPWWYGGPYYGEWGTFVSSKSALQVNSELTSGSGSVIGNGDGVWSMSLQADALSDYSVNKLGKLKGFEA